MHSGALVGVDPAAAQSMVDAGVEPAPLRGVEVRRELPRGRRRSRRRSRRAGAATNSRAWSSIGSRPAAVLHHGRHASTPDQRSAALRRLAGSLEQLGEPDERHEVALVDRQRALQRLLLSAASSPCSRKALARFIHSSGESRIGGDGPAEQRGGLAVPPLGEHGQPERIQGDGLLRPRGRAVLEAVSPLRPSAPIAALAWPRRACAESLLGPWDPISQSASAGQRPPPRISAETLFARLRVGDFHAAGGDPAGCILPKILPLALPFRLGLAGAVAVGQRADPQ